MIENADTIRQSELCRKAEETAITSYGNNSYLLAFIVDYYRLRNLKWPTVEEALMWAQTESGEVYEQLLAREGGWVRNNPDEHEEYDRKKLAEEISDQILMLLVAGMVDGFDILQIMRDKMERKLKELGL